MHASGSAAINLKDFTDARIALGFSGHGTPTAHHLRFQADHALARDAVYAGLDIDQLVTELQTLGLDSLLVHSQAQNRAEYLRRPDLGRQLDEQSRGRLTQAAATAPANFDLVFILADGLSATALEINAIPFLKTLLPRLTGYQLAPLIMAQQARVALGDSIAALLKAKIAIMLIGERPGLSAADSMGLYLTFAPQPGLTDERRNCISNVRPRGLDYETTARQLLSLIEHSIRKQISGVALGGLGMLE